MEHSVFIADYKIVEDKVVGNLALLLQISMISKDWFSIKSF